MEKQGSRKQGYRRCFTQRSDHTHTKKTDDVFWIVSDDTITLGGGFSEKNRESYEETHRRAAYEVLDSLPALPQPANRDWRIVARHVSRYTFRPSFLELLIFTPDVSHLMFHT